MSSTSSPRVSHCLSTPGSAARLETGDRGGLWKRWQEGYSKRLHIKTFNMIQVLFGEGCVPFRALASIAVHLMLYFSCEWSAAAENPQPKSCSSQLISKSRGTCFISFVCFFLYGYYFRVIIVKESVRRQWMWSTSRLNFSDDRFFSVPVLSNNTVECKGGFLQHIEFKVNKFQVAVKVWKTHIFLLVGENVMEDCFYELTFKTRWFSLDMSTDGRIPYPALLPQQLTVCNA